MYITFKTREYTACVWSWLALPSSPSLQLTLHLCFIFPCQDSIYAPGQLSFNPADLDPLSAFAMSSATTPSWSASSSSSSSYAATCIPPLPLTTREAAATYAYNGMPPQHIAAPATTHNAYSNHLSGTKQQRSWGHKTQAANDSANSWAGYVVDKLRAPSSLASSIMAPILLDPFASLFRSHSSSVQPPQQQHQQLPQHMPGIAMPSNMSRLSSVSSSTSSMASSMPSYMLPPLPLSRPASPRAKLADPSIAYDQFVPRPRHIGAHQQYPSFADFRHRNPPADPHHYADYAHRPAPPLRPLAPKARIAQQYSILPMHPLPASLR